MSTPLADRPSERDRRAAYYHAIDKWDMTPLWESLHSLVPPRPNPPVRPALWRYADARPFVIQAGSLISAKEAVRRVLILENPGLRGTASITQSLYAGLQLILPGEVAPAHRHSQTALRLVLEGEGAYTAVDGERIPMKRGDFIITPAHTWHDHGHLGKDPVIWLDGLDIPLVRFLDAGFAEDASAAVQTVSRPEGDTLARYGANMVPVDERGGEGVPSRLCHFPFERTRAALADLGRTEPDPHLGHKLRFVSPATGRGPMPTMGAFAQALPKGFETAPVRATDGTVYCCLEGRGTALVGPTELAFEENDVFVVPSWMPLRLKAGAATILFSYSDRPVQEVLGLWREERVAVR